MARREINGIEVNPFYLLAEDAERIGNYLDSMPDDHPDLDEWIERYDNIFKKILEVRRCLI